MSENNLNWLAKLKNKYQSEIDKLRTEEYRYLVTNYRFEGSTLLFIFNFQLELLNLTILIVNHNSTLNEVCKYIDSIPVYLKRHIQIEYVMAKLELIIDENEELHSIKDNLLKIIENQIKRKRKFCI